MDVTKKMTREDLIEILTMDGTADEIDKALINKELSQSERDRIYDFLLADSKERAEQIFAQILKDIESAPVYETAVEEKKSWKEMRLDLAAQIKDLNDQKFKLEEQRKIFDKTAQDIEQSIGPLEAKKFLGSVEETIEMNRAKLAIKTNQHIALSLMHAEAKSMEAQANARIFMEATQPYRDALRQGWKDLTDQVRTAHQHAQNFHAAIRQTKQLDKNFIGDIANQLHLAVAKHQLKRLNRTQEKIDKEERKMLAKANRVSAKEFRREKFLAQLHGWKEGKEVPEMELEVIKDVERAQEVLKGSKHFDDKKLEAMQYNLSKLKEHQADVRTSLVQTLCHVAEVLHTRRDNVQSVAQSIYERDQGGDFGELSDSKMSKIETNLERGVKATMLDQSVLDKGLKDFMINNGFEDIVDARER